MHHQLPELLNEVGDGLESLEVLPVLVFLDFFFFDFFFFLLLGEELGWVVPAAPLADDGAVISSPNGPTVEDIRVEALSCVSAHLPFSIATMASFNFYRYKRIRAQPLQ